MTKGVLVNYDEALEETRGVSRSLLLGNGFSQSCPLGARFSFSSLKSVVYGDLSKGSKSLFSEMATNDFEAIIKSLDDARAVARSFGKKRIEKIIKKESEKVRGCLISAIRAVHPERGNDIEVESRKAAAEFISKFTNIYTLNYDLLLYWLIFESNVNHSDGFRRKEGRLTFDPDQEFSINFLHGGLHLFELPDGQVRKAERGNRPTIIDSIEVEIANGNAPIYVAEGSSDEKVKRIRGNEYLLKCYSNLKSESGSLFVFGAKLGASDNHICEAIRVSGINRVYFFMKDFDDVSMRLSEAKLVEIGVNYKFIDASQAKVWG